MSVFHIDASACICPYLNVSRARGVYISMKLGLEALLVAHPVGLSQGFTIGCPYCVASRQRKLLYSSVDYRIGP